jgi:hypothetical protein
MGMYMPPTMGAPESMEDAQTAPPKAAATAKNVTAQRMRLLSAGKGHGGHGCAAGGLRHGTGQKSAAGQHGGGSVKRADERR